MGPKPVNKRPKSVVGHKVVLKNGSNKPAKKILSIIKQPARINRSGSSKGDRKKKVAKVASANVTKIIKQDFQRPAQKQKQKQQRLPTQPNTQQQQPIEQPTQPRGRGIVGQMYSGTSAGSFMAGSMALQTAQAVASNRGHPKHQEVGELLNTMNKGWIDQGKFAEVLQGILF